MNKKITFGIAVCNVEPFIDDCLSSVLAQKGDDIEIIIVDDGSRDASGKICDEYAAKDSRIRVFHKENGGISSARNLTIENAAGEWICFADGDDMLTPNAAETIRRHLSEEYDIIYFDVIHFRFANSISEYPSGRPSKELKGPDALRQLLLDTLYRSGSANASKYSCDYINKTIHPAWGKVYKREFLLANHIRFDLKARKAQDIIMNFHCAQCLKSALLVREAIYLFRYNSGSITRRFNPSILEYNNHLGHVFDGDIAAMDEPIRKEAMERYQAFRITSIHICAMLYFCNRANQQKYAERKKEFEAYVAQDWCAEAAQSCNVDLLNPADRVTFQAITCNQFWRLCLLVRRRQRWEAMKRVSNRFKLNRVKSMIRNRIKKQSRDE